eukprot:m.782397 g.782397  ORF g.782397 m.782397 type:complete len:338 (-) comp23290_c0_seq19:984-1997(-)
MNLFASDNPICLCSAARLVRNLCVQPKTAGALAELQLCAGLDKCLRSGDNATQAAAGDALTVLCEGSTFRQQFADHAGSCDALKALLDHSEAVDVRQNAYRAVRACADSAALAQTLCAIGALHPLGTSTNAFARVAYTQLLTQHLPAKYAFTGDLGLGDITTNGFFDPGAMAAHTEFVGLEALRQAPVNTRREVLEVNTETDSSLATFIEKLRETVGDDKGMNAVRTIAKAVAERMGGAVALADMDSFRYALAISQLKMDTGSNIVPLGQVCSLQEFLDRRCATHACCIGACTTVKVLSSCTAVQICGRSTWNRFATDPGRIRAGIQCHLHNGNPCG